MPNKPTDPKNKRLRRRDPRRAGPNRRAADHIMLARRTNGDKVQGPPISESVQQAIGGMVRQSSAFIEDQIRAGQAAAERMREGMASSGPLSSDINMMVENLVAATRDVGATWLDLISIILRSIGAPARPAGDPSGGATGGSSGGGRPPPTMPGRTVRRSGRSGAATTLSSITPADASIPGVPPHIMVKGANVTSAALDLRPSSARFVPHVRHLVAADPKHSLSAKFSASSDPLRLVLTIDVPAGQPPGIYTGAVVDSSTNEPGGTISVTVAG
jgi:hypothetical protein